MYLAEKGGLDMAKAKLLLVDDEVPFVETMTKRLTKRELEIITAFSGEEALKRLKENDRIEVVILDVKMPGMDGLETLREIKNSHPLVEVVMLTGHATVETAILGMKLGAFDYGMKPVNIDELLEKIRQAHERKQIQEQERQ